MHDKSGHLLKSSPEALEVLQHHHDKIEKNLEKYQMLEKDFEQGAKITLISFLATDLAAKEAVSSARSAGHKINHLSLMSLFPVSEKEIIEATKNSDVVIIPEENQNGQYADMIKHLFADKKLIKVNEISKLISPEKIYQAITGELNG